jgi:hypothetical protein
MLACTVLFIAKILYAMEQEESSNVSANTATLLLRSSDGQELEIQRGHAASLKVLLLRTMSITKSIMNYCRK